MRARFGDGPYFEWFTASYRGVDESVSLLENVLATQVRFCVGVDLHSLYPEVSEVL